MIVHRLDCAELGRGFSFRPGLSRIFGTFVPPEFIFVDCHSRVAPIAFREGLITFAHSFCVSPSPGKEASAGSGGIPGGESNQLPGGRHHHAGGAAALDVP